MGYKITTDSFQSLLFSSVLPLTLSTTSPRCYPFFHPSLPQDHCWYICRPHFSPIHASLHQDQFSLMTSKLSPYPPYVSLYPSLGSTRTPSSSIFLFLSPSTSNPIFLLSICLYFFQRLFQPKQSPSFFLFFLQQTLNIWRKTA